MATINVTPRPQDTSKCFRCELLWYTCSFLFVQFLPSIFTITKGLKENTPCLILHHSKWTFWMTCRSKAWQSLCWPLCSISLFLGSAALLLVNKSSYPIMSGAMLEWSPCPYLPHITWPVPQQFFYAADQCKLSLFLSLSPRSRICQTDSFFLCRFNQFLYSFSLSSWWNYLFGQK